MLIIVSSCKKMGERTWLLCNTRGERVITGQQVEYGGWVGRGKGESRDRSILYVCLCIIGYINHKSRWGRQFLIVHEWMGQGILLLGSLKAVNLSPLSSVISWFYFNECYYCATVYEGAVWGELTRFEPFSNLWLSFLIFTVIYCR